MNRKYISRSIAPFLRRTAAEFPAVVLTGPRQAGKTTELRKIFGKRAGYVSLEPPDIRGAAITDPRRFLDAHPAPVIFDEVQNVPELLPFIKDRIDARRATPGQYMLTGSQNLLLLERITESLAGRAAILQMMPLSLREMRRQPARPLPWEPQPSGKTPPAMDAKTLWTALLRGGYPELSAQPNRSRATWHSSYIQTYLERDVRTLRQIGDLTSFQIFMRALASRVGQLLNLSDLSRDLGIALNTVKAWIAVLEASFQIMVLRPYYNNAGKRLVKTPKIYFTDTGTLCHLSGLRDIDHAAAGPMGGAIFETAVLMEIVKTLRNRGEDPQVYFWRTSAGAEVDIVVESQGTLIPIEVKLSSTPRPAMAEGIQKFQADYGAKCGPGFVVHPGDVRMPLGYGATAIPFSDL